MSNCTEAISSKGLAISALVIELILSLLGAIGSGLSLYCLLTCKKVQEGMKIHLCLLFSMSLVTCCLGLPGNAVVEYGNLVLWNIHPDVISGFVAFYTILGQIDRNIYSVLAVKRMVAVVFPIKFNAISRKTVSIVIDVILCVSVTTTWTIAFVSKGFASITDPGSSPLGYILYCTFILIPLIITVIAYIIMILFLASKKRIVAEFKSPTRGEKDQPTKPLTILILINIALDVPHIIIHLLRICPTGNTFVVIHVFYRLHFAIDPFVFIGLNRRYRQMVLRKFSSLVQAVRVSDSTHAFREGTPGTTQVQIDTRCHLPAATS